MSFTCFGRTCDSRTADDDDDDDDVTGDWLEVNELRLRWFIDFVHPSIYYIYTANGTPPAAHENLTNEIRTFVILSQCAEKLRLNAHFLYSFGIYTKSARLNNICISEAFRARRCLFEKHNSEINLFAILSAGIIFFCCSPRI